MANRDRLLELIETEVPRRYRGEFRRFAERSTDDEFTGIIADMVEGGAIAAALDLIGDQRLASLFTTLVGRIRRAFNEYVGAFQSDDMFRLIVTMLGENRLDEAVDLVDSHIVRMSAVIPQSYTYAGAEIAEDIQAALDDLRPGVRITFDPTNPQAADEARQQAYDLIREISDEQKAAIRQAVTDALARGGGPREAALAYRDAIGLTERQEAAVRNYRRILETDPREALTRALRDRRFDSSLQVDEPLSPEHIERMVQRYRERYLAYRAEVIARTESTRALSAANHEAFRQTVESLGMSPNDVQKTWHSTRDGRTRPSHWVMNEQKVRGLDTDFRTGAGFRLKYPGDHRAPAEETVNCRCTVTYRLVSEPVE